jgi:hypothetical protein
LSVVLPARNEAGNIDAAVGAALALQRRVDTLEVIVVDDGSDDETAARVTARMDGEPRLRLRRHSRSLGYGAALRSGFAAASLEWVLFTDADLQFDLDDVGPLLARAAVADVVVGWRVQRADPVARKCLGATWSALCRQLLGVPVRDVNCALKLLRRELLVALQLRAEGAFVNAELLARAAQQGARFQEVPVHHRPRRHGQASGARFAVALGAARELVVRTGELRREGTPRFPGGAGFPSGPPGRGKSADLAGETQDVSVLAGSGHEVGEQVGRVRSGRDDGRAAASRQVSGEPGSVRSVDGCGEAEDRRPLPGCG